MAMSTASDSERDEQPKKTKSTAEEQDGSEEEEYEIEAILDAKRGVFQNGHIGYFVKWKGYGEDQNSWVDEEDANAPELIEEFWRNNTKKRKSMDKTSAKKSEAEPSKKRGRKSQVNDGDNDDDDQSKAAKRRKSQPPKEETAEDESVKNMSAYYSKSSWEDLVDVIDTVENDNKKLWVYFSLKNGDRIRESADKCNAKCPQKMIKFYENNLRWREAEIEETTP